MHPRFTAKTLSFLRALKRNNRREWFAPRKADYERDVRAPMIAVVEQLGVRPSNRRDNPDFSCCAFPMPIANLGDGRNGPR